MAGNEGHGASVGAWVATFIMIAAFIVGGIAIVIHTWWLFWVAVGAFVVGVVFGRVVHMMDQVSEYEMPAARASGGDPSSSSSF